LAAWAGEARRVNWAHFSSVRNELLAPDGVRQVAALILDPMARRPVAGRAWPMDLPAVLREFSNATVSGAWNLG